MDAREICKASADCTEGRVIVIGTNDAFLLFREATEGDVKEFYQWLADEQDELREFPSVDAPDDLRARGDDRAKVKARCLMEFSRRLLVGASSGFTRDHDCH